MLSSNTTKNLPNTHRRSTTETAMNPIGQAFPVIHMHLVVNSDQPSFANCTRQLMSRTHNVFRFLTVLLLFESHLFMANVPQRARLPVPRTATLTSCLWSLRSFPSLYGSHLTNFYCDASVALLQRISQWLCFTY